MKKSSITINRRSFVGGSAAAAGLAVTSGLFTGTAAKAATEMKRVVSHKPVDLMAYHCSLVHKAMSDKLTRIVADPTILPEEANAALHSTFCPCCNTQISANFSDIAAQMVDAEMSHAKA